MKHYLKLVNFEFSRFFKLFLVLIGITVILQIVGVIYESQSHVSMLNELIYEEHRDKNEVVGSYGTMSFVKIVDSGWFLGPIALCAVTLIMYVFFIWYRDWFGKNTFVYRLLMLPTSRLNIYLAKATTILIFVLGLIALQLALIPIESQILQWIVPDEYRTDFTLMQITSIDYLAILYPRTFTEFVFYYGAGMLAVLTLFTAILFERSYRLKGILYGILFSTGAIVAFLTPLLIDSFVLRNYFFPVELALLQVGFGLLVLGAVVATGNYLMKYKVRV